jgi:hypothetical protein
MREALAGIAARSLLGSGRFLARAAQVVNHLAAGTLTIDGLRAGIERNWENFNAGDADIAAGLTRVEEEIVARFLKRGDDLLLVGSGAGRDLIALGAAGFQVTGVEPARRAAALCRHQLQVRGLQAGVIDGFFEDVALPRCFNAIVFAGCCYGMIPGSARRIAALRKAAAHLARRGRIVIDYMIEPPAHPALIRLTRFAATITGSDWRPEAGDVVMAMSSTPPLFNYEHRFAPGELESEARAAGLQAADRGGLPHAPLIVLEACSN